MRSTVRTDPDPLSWTHTFTCQQYLLSPSLVQSCHHRSAGRPSPPSQHSPRPTAGHEKVQSHTTTCDQSHCARERGHPYDNLSSPRSHPRKRTRQFTETPEDKYPPRCSSSEFLRSAIRFAPTERPRVAGSFPSQCVVSVIHPCTLARRTLARCMSHAVQGHRPALLSKGTFAPKKSGNEELCRTP